MLGTPHSSQSTVSGGGSGFQTPSESTWVPQSAEIRAMEKFLEISGSGSFQEGSAAKVVPRKPPGPPQSRLDTQKAVCTQSGVDLQSRSNFPVTENGPRRQKRGTDALPRSNSMEATAPKLPRTEEQRLGPRKTVGAGAPPHTGNHSPSQTTRQPATPKGGTGPLPRATPPAMNPSRQQNATQAKDAAPRANSPATDAPKQIKPTQRKTATDGASTQSSSAASSTKTPTPKSGASGPPRPKPKGPAARETSRPDKAGEKVCEGSTKKVCV